MTQDGANITVLPAPAPAGIPQAPAAVTPIVVTRGTISNAPNAPRIQWVAADAADNPRDTSLRKKKKQASHTDWFTDRQKKVMPNSDWMTEFLGVKEVEGGNLAQATGLSVRAQQGLGESGL